MEKIWLFDFYIENSCSSSHRYEVVCPMFSRPMPTTRLFPVAHVPCFSCLLHRAAGTCTTFLAEPRSSHSCRLAQSFSLSFTLVPAPSFRWSMRATSLSLVIKLSHITLPTPLHIFAGRLALGRQYGEIYGEERPHTPAACSHA